MSRDTSTLIITAIKATKELCGSRKGAHVMMAILTHGLQSSLLPLRMIISRSGVRSQEES